jgi:hypothetical protein
MNAARGISLLLVAALLPACDQTKTGRRSIFAPKLTKQRSAIIVTKGDGTTRPSHVTYHETVTCSGLTLKSAVELDCYNFISGYQAEKAVLERRFPGARHKRLADERSGKKIYHRYSVEASSKPPFVFWIDATDYHDFF